MKTYYKININNKIEELNDDDIIDTICLMRIHGMKDNKFYDMVKEHLVRIFLMWQDNWPEEVDPDFQIFDSVENAQKQQQENREAYKLNEEIKKEINLVERNRLKQVHEFVEGIRRLEVEEEGKE